MNGEKCAAVSRKEARWILVSISLQRVPLGLRLTLKVIFDHSMVSFKWDDVAPALEKFLDDFAILQGAEHLHSANNQAW